MVKREVSWLQLIERDILKKKSAVPLQRLHGVDGELRRKLLGQKNIVSNSRSDIYEASSGGNGPDYLDKNILFLGLVNISYLIPLPLACGELIVKYPDTIVKPVNFPCHRRTLRSEQNYYRSELIRRP
jgi:hypothetical protein